jgi:hypothetical protein
MTSIDIHTSHWCTLLYLLAGEKKPGYMSPLKREDASNSGTF